MMVKNEYERIVLQRLEDARANVEHYKKKWLEAQSQLQKAETDYQNLYPIRKSE
jgi:hypothetical protein